MVDSLVVTPASTTVNHGEQSQFTAIATMSDSSQLDVTSTATWTSSNPYIGSVSSSGLMSTTGAGSVTITATLANVPGQAAVTVNTRIPTSWNVRNIGSNIESGQTGFYFVDGTSGVVNGTNIVVAIDNAGHIRRSLDKGASWTVVQTIPGSVSGSYAAFGNGTFVVFAAGAGWTSTDGGLTWTLAWAPDQAVHCLTFCNDRFIAGADGGFYGVYAMSGRVYTSSDGITWETQNIFMGSSIMGVGGGNGIYYATDGTSFYQSTDGTTWTHTATVSNNGYCKDIAVGAGTAITIDWQGHVFTCDTTSGAWSMSTTPAPMSAETIKFANGIFVAASGGQFMTSSNGVTWSVVLPGATDPTWVHGLTHTGTEWLSLGGTGYGNATDPHLLNHSAFRIVPTVLASTDATKWTHRDWTEANYLTTAYGGDAGQSGHGLFVAAGFQGVLVTSPDGITWTPRNSNTHYDITTVTYGNGLFVGFATDTLNPDSVCQELRSVDGITWTATTLTPSAGNVTPNINNSINRVAFGNNRFVAVGGSSTANNAAGSSAVITSTDGLTWSAGIPNTHLPIAGVGYANGHFIMLDLCDSYWGDVNTSEHSDDGLNWLVNPNNLKLWPGSSTSAVWAGGATVVFGNGIYATALHRPDRNGVGTGCRSTSSWNAFPPVWDQNISGRTDYVFQSGVFLSVDSQNVYASTEPYEGTVQYADASPGVLSGVSAGNGTFVVVGEGGRLLQCTP